MNHLNKTLILLLLLLCLGLALENSAKAAEISKKDLTELNSQLELFGLQPYWRKTAAQKIIAKYQPDVAPAPVPLIYDRQNVLTNVVETFFDFIHWSSSESEVDLKNFFLPGVATNIAPSCQIDTSGTSSLHAEMVAIRKTIRKKGGGSINISQKLVDLMKKRFLHLRTEIENNFIALKHNEGLAQTFRKAVVKQLQTILTADPLPEGLAIEEFDPLLLEWVINRAFVAKDGREGDVYDHQTIASRARDILEEEGALFLFLQKHDLKTIDRHLGGEEATNNLIMNSIDYLKSLSGDDQIADIFWPMFSQKIIEIVEALPRESFHFSEDGQLPTLLKEMTLAIRRNMQNKIPDDLSRYPAAEIMRHFKICLAELIKLFVTKAVYVPSGLLNRLDSEENITAIDQTVRFALISTVIYFITGEIDPRFGGLPKTHQEIAENTYRLAVKVGTILDREEGEQQSFWQSHQKLAEIAEINDQPEEDQLREKKLLLAAASLRNILTAINGEPLLREVITEAARDRTGFTNLLQLADSSQTFEEAEEGTGLYSTSRLHRYLRVSEQQAEILNQALVVLSESFAAPPADSSIREIAELSFARKEINLEIEIKSLGINLFNLQQFLEGNENPGILNRLTRDLAKKREETEEKKIAELALAVNWLIGQRPPEELAGLIDKMKGLQQQEILAWSSEQFRQLRGGEDFDPAFFNYLTQPDLPLPEWLGSDTKQLELSKRLKNLKELRSR